MKKLIVVIMLILSGSCVMAQHTADIGVQVAAATYWGDIQKQNNAKSVTPVVGILGRWNFNRRLAFRGQLLTGNLKAEGIFDQTFIGQSGASAANFVADPKYSYNFNRSFQTVEGLLEFNFHDYKLGSLKKNAFTPFVSLGIGAFYSRAPRTGSFILDPIAALPVTIPAQYPPFLNGSGKRTNGLDVLTLTIPVGAGFKFNFTKRLGGLVEVIIRKTFSDNIDNLDDPKRFQGFVSTPTIPTYVDATKRMNKNDYYATLAFSLTWQLWSDKGNCAIYDKIKNKK